MHASVTSAFCRMIPHPYSSFLLAFRQDMDGSPHWGSWETFTAVDAGAGKARMRSKRGPSYHPGGGDRPRPQQNELL